MTVADRIAATAARYDGADDEAARLTAQALARREWRLRRSGKTCSRCSQTKPISAFGPDSRRPDGLRYSCRPCEARRARERAAFDELRDLLDEA